MKKLLVGMTVGLLVLGPAAMMAHADNVVGGTEGCTVNGQASGPAVGGGVVGAQPNKTACTYTATRDGGFVASGYYRIVVNGTTYRSTDASPAKQGCTLWHAGAAVFATNDGGTDVIAVGNPYPADTVDETPNC